MPFNWNNFPYTNFHELNLDWFSEHFKEIFEEWEDLYNTLTQWKDNTDADLAQWKEDTLADMDTWERELLAALDEWKVDTGNDISEWESGVISDLNDWKETFLAAYESLEDRVEAIVSDTEDMVENLAEPFSNSTSYSSGDYVIYNGVLYEFTADHAAGSWIGTDAEQRTAMNDINNLKNTVIDMGDYVGVYITSEHVGYLREDGEYYNDARYHALGTDYIPCSEGDVFVYKGRTTAAAVSAIFYDSSKSILSYTHDGTTNNYTNITIPSTCAYVVFSSMEPVGTEVTLDVYKKDSWRSEIPDIENSIIRIGNSFIVTNTYLSDNNISDVRNLPIDKAYIISGVTIANLANLPPISGTTAYGILMSYRGYTNKIYGVCYFYMTMNGQIYTGIDVNDGTIRWTAYPDTSVTNGLTASLQYLGGTQTIRPFGDILTNSYLVANNIDDVRDLTTNRIYFLSNITRSNLANMPIDNTLGSSTVYTGWLLKYSGYVTNNYGDAYLYIDNMGGLYSGNDVTVGNVRWKPACQRQNIDELTADLYNKSVLLLGDSIMYGSNMSDYEEGNRTVITIRGTTYKNNLSTKVWSSKFVDYLTSEYSDTVVNNSFPGARFDDLVDNLATLVTQTYNYVIMCLGVNNWNTMGQVETALHTLADRFRSTNTKMLILLPLDSTTYKSELAQIRGIIKKFGV